MHHSDGRLAAFYETERDLVGHSISPHLETLLDLASGYKVVCEFGVQRGSSSSALLLGAEEVYSYDIKETARARELKNIVGGRWHYTIKSTLDIRIPECEMLFIDSLHTYDQCSRELALHSSRVSHRLVFHDTITFGSVGAMGETGNQSWTYRRGIPVPPEHLGIRPAIDKMMINDPSWKIEAHYVNAHGLLVLRRG